MKTQTYNDIGNAIRTALYAINLARALASKLGPDELRVVEADMESAQVALNQCALTIVELWSMGKLGE